MAPSDFGPIIINKPAIARLLLITPLAFCMRSAPLLVAASDGYGFWARLGQLGGNRRATGPGSGKRERLVRALGLRENLEQPKPWPRKKTNRVVSKKK